MQEIRLVRVGDVDSEILSWLLVALADTLNMPCTLEEMVIDPELKGQAARIRERARSIRAELKRHSAEPNWELVQEQVERGERPSGDDVAEGFFHLARVEERSGPRDEHNRFRAADSTLDPLDPPLERLRRRLGVDPPT